MSEDDVAELERANASFEIRQQTWKLMSDVIDYHPACSSVLQGLYEGLADVCGRHIGVTMRAAATGNAPLVWSIV